MSATRTRVTRAQATALAERTETAYSCDRYTSWTALAAGLLRYGYTEREAEAILRSKWTRWASYSGGNDRAHYGKASARASVEYITRCLTPAEVAELVDGTFAGGTD